jgi:uncharacterized Zn finger protein
MNDTAERVTVACPACGPQTVHEILSPGGTATVQCTECGHTHKADLSDPATTDLSVVVSQSGDSFSATTEAPAGETLATGEEFVLDTEEAMMVVRITSLELPDDSRTDSAPADEVATVWTRAVGNVVLDVTVHPVDGRHDDTESVSVRVPGDEEYVVGQDADLGQETVTVEGIYLREDARGYDHRKLDHAGDSAPAKDIERLYARGEGERAWSAW